MRMEALDKIRFGPDVVDSLVIVASIVCDILCLVLVLQCSAFVSFLVLQSSR